MHIVWKAALTLIGVVAMLVTAVNASSQTPDFSSTKSLAEQGDAHAQTVLGSIYSYGEGVPKNYSNAIKWYRKAAEQGYSHAQFNLGVMYANGDGVPENDAEAVKLYRNAAEQGLAEAQTNLGKMYATGEGVPENYVLAYLWLSLAGAQGDEVAKMNKGIVAGWMTRKQIEIAQSLSATCFENNYKDCG